MQAQKSFLFTYMHIQGSEGSISNTIYQLYISYEGSSRISPKIPNGMRCAVGVAVITVSHIGHLVSLRLRIVSPVFYDALRENSKSATKVNGYINFSFLRTKMCESAVEFG